MRDKRGYETTYLMHWFRDGARNRSRVLYMFRTPGGVRVGRLPLDREVLRQIEAQHPDIQFDWNAVRETQQVIEPAPEFRRRRPRREEGDTAQSDSAASASASAAAVAAEPAPASTTRQAAADAAAPAATPAATPSASAVAPQVPRLQVPATIDGNSPDEQIAFLLKWHPLISDRLAQRTADPERRAALLALAERLNPAAWTDADQITTGLQQAAEALERLSHVFAKRRRRGRKKPRGATDGPGGPLSTTADGAADADATEESEATELPDGDESSSLE